MNEKLGFQTTLKVIAILAMSLLITGCCGIDGKPRPRMGTLPTPPPGPRFANPENLGKHSYGYNPFEINSVVYTCSAGHIDITHLRWNADYTRYAIKKIQKTLLNKRKGFSFTMALEVSKHDISFTYPDNWDSLPKDQKQKIAEEVSYELGPYIAFNATLWHEIITWFGTHFAGFEPEFNSAFSWEDMYSNLLGTKLAVQAVKDKEHKYNTAMTIAIDQAIQELGPKPASVAIKAAEDMRGKWFTGVLNVQTIRKNMDTGMDDGYVSPVLVPGVCDDAKPEPLPAPTTNTLEKYGLSMKYIIHPHEWERGKIFKVVYGKSNGGKIIEPSVHFPILMKYIEKQAIEKYNYILE